MLVYNYHHTTSVYLGTSSEADPAPWDDTVFLIPAYATIIVPPFAPDGQQAVFDGEAWVVEPIPVPVRQNITSVPTSLFGGPTMLQALGG